MSQYSPLANYLACQTEGSWQATFDQIEHIIGRSLPQSAYKRSEWWDNNSKNHSQRMAWRGAGWLATKVDLAERKVRFVRESVAQGAGSEMDRLVQSAQSLTGLPDQQAVILLALKELVQREAARHLIALGGTMPDFEAAPRERPLS
jgi:Bacterial antitoxin of type II TA system, VapB